jgi:hypothetical protein
MRIERSRLYDIAKLAETGWHENRLIHASVSGDLLMLLGDERLKKMHQKLYDSIRSVITAICSDNRDYPSVLTYQLSRFSAKLFAKENRGFYLPISAAGH